MSKELIISRVFPNSIAFKAGMQVGWAVLQIDGQHVINLPEAQRALGTALAKGAGYSFTMVVSTSGR
jgi:C-terminal processing protease CtpA/Prc